MMKSATITTISIITLTHNKCFLKLRAASEIDTTQKAIEKIASPVKEVHEGK